MLQLLIIVTGELIMNRVESGDDGMYKCVATNPADRAETEVRINVLVKPQIYELLNSTTPVGNETRLVCKTKGRPPPRVTFRKLSNPEPFQVGQQPNDDRITLEQQTNNDAGKVLEFQREIHFDYLVSTFCVSLSLIILLNLIKLVKFYL